MGENFVEEKLREVGEALEAGDFGRINSIINESVNAAIDEVRRQVGQVQERMGFQTQKRTDKDPGGADAFAAYGPTKEKADAAPEPPVDYAARYRKQRRYYYGGRTIYSSGRHGGSGGRPGTGGNGGYGGQPGAGGSGGYGGQPGAGGGYSGQPGAGADRPAVYRKNELGTIDKRKLSPSYYRKKGRVSGVLCTVFGGIGLGVFGTGTFFLLLDLLTNLYGITAQDLQGTLFIAAFAAVGGILLNRGIGLRARLKRSERYLKLMGERWYIRLEDLAVRTGMSLKKVRRDVRRMLKAGIFPEGHLDAGESVLVLNDETWGQYLLALKQEEESRPEDTADVREEPEAEPADLSAEQQIEKDGQAYMERLRQLNLQIPGEVISNKLYQLDYLLQRIFMVLKKHPEKCPQMRKFMDYYLPTTVKLVESYADFDRAGVQGENIKGAREEIEKTMETINQAFEKLLDDMYQDAALEATADARVLKTVLAQDGYGQKDFDTDRA